MLNINSNKHKILKFDLFNETSDVVSFVKDFSVDFSCLKCSLKTKVKVHCEWIWGPLSHGMFLCSRTVYRVPYFFSKCLMSNHIYYYSKEEIKKTVSISVLDGRLRKNTSAKRSI